MTYGKESLENRLIAYLRWWKENRPEEWVSGMDLEKKAIEAGYKGSTASRQCRLLAEEGILERKEFNNTVFYRFNW